MRNNSTLPGFPSPGGWISLLLLYLLLQGCSSTWNPLDPVNPPDVPQSPAAPQPPIVEGPDVLTVDPAATNLRAAGRP